MPQFIVAHPTAFWLAVGYVAITAVGTMPSPSEKSTAFYKWAFAFLHGITAQLPRVAATLAPTSVIGQKIIGAANLAEQQACADAEKKA